VEAENAVSALTIVQTFCGRLDLIVSEVNTPGDMNGLELARAIRNTFPWIPIILTSVYNDNAGGFDLILKPFAPNAILNAVDKAMTFRSERALHAAAGHQ
jgi:CheY-like chemotaxis protein